MFFSEGSKALVDNIVNGYTPDMTTGKPVNNSAPTNPGYTTVNVNQGSDGPDWLSAGSGALDTVLKFTGGLVNLHQQKKANAEAKRQFNESLAFAKDQFYNYMQHRVDDALKAGVHPLAALGVSAHGSASPTAHYQAATGLGSSMANVGAALNSMFENMVKARQLKVMDTQIAANEALAVKYGADAGRQIAETKLADKELNNYHLYRAWNAVNGSISAITGGYRVMNDYRLGVANARTRAYDVLQEAAARHNADSFGEYADAFAGYRGKASSWMLKSLK